MSDFNADERELEAYQRAYERLQYALEEWNAAGCPLTTTHRNGMTGSSVLWRVVREAETDCAKRLARARTRHRGPSPAAVVGSTIGESPASRLRVVKPPS